MPAAELHRFKFKISVFLEGGRDEVMGRKRQDHDRLFTLCVVISRVDKVGQADVVRQAKAEIGGHLQERYQILHIKIRKILHDPVGIFREPL